MRRAVLLIASLWTMAAFAQHDHTGHAATQPPPADTSTDAQPIDPEHGKHVDASRPAFALPKPSAADIEAAFPDLHGMDMSSHMREDPWISSLRFDSLEHGISGDGATAWQLHAFTGKTRDRLWLRSHGERDDHGSHGNVELMWGHATGPWWDRMIGLRQDFSGGRQRHWLGVGVHGHAPYKFDAEGTAYLGRGGRLMAEGSLGYDVLFTNRLVLRPEVAATLHSRDDPAMRTGSGLSELSAGLRMRYEFSRHFAPYLGWKWSRAYGATATLRAAHGDPASDHGFVAGVRFWY